MKKLFLSLLFLTAFTGAATATTQDAENFAKRIADRLVVEVMQSKDPVAQKRQKFEEIFVTDSDMDMIVKFVLSRSYKTASPEQREAFKAAFIDNFVATWADRFTKYRGESINFTSTRQDKKEFWSTSEIQVPDSDKPIVVLWRMREKNGALKVVDLVAEGVSMLQNYRNEYTSVLQQNNGDVGKLTAMLKKKNADMVQNRK